MEKKIEIEIKNYNIINKTIFSFYSWSQYDIMYWKKNWSAFQSVKNIKKNNIGISVGW
jgi:hypothetical protein